MLDSDTAALCLHRVMKYSKFSCIVPQNSRDSSKKRVLTPKLRRCFRHLEGHDLLDISGILNEMSFFCRVCAMT